MKNVKGNIYYSFNDAKDLGGWSEPLKAIMTGILQVQKGGETYYE